MLHALVLKNLQGIEENNFFAHWTSFEIFAPK